MDDDKSCTMIVALAEGAKMVLAFDTVFK